MNGCKVKIRKAYCEDKANAVLVEYKKVITE